MNDVEKLETLIEYYVRDLEEEIKKYTSLGVNLEKFIQQKNEVLIEFENTKKIKVKVEQLLTRKPCYSKGQSILREIASVRKNLRKIAKKYQV